MHVGVDVSGKELLDEFDAVVITTGAENPRNLDIPGRDLEGIYYAMQFLPQQNRRGAGRPVDREFDVTAEGKHVIIIGGGDTGADCLGTTRRQGAKSIRQFELLPKPPMTRDEPGAFAWPLWPFTFRAESSHAEGDVREWAVNTKEFLGDENGHVRALWGVELEWPDVDPETNRRPFKFEEKSGAEFEVPADLVLLAMGFLGRFTTAWSTGWNSKRIREATSRRRLRNFKPRTKKSSSPATRAAASRWLCGPWRKVAKPPMPSTHT